MEVKKLTWICKHGFKSKSGLTYSRGKKITDYEYSQLLEEEKDNFEPL